MKYLNDTIRRLRQLLRPLGASSSTDKELLERYVAAREEEAFSTLLQRHGPMVLGVCRRILGDHHAAEDAFQATFMILARKSAAIGWRDSVANWLYSVAFRVASKLKSQALRRRRSEAAAVPPEQPAAPDRIEWRDLRGVLDEELQHLPARFRIPVVLCYLEGLTRDEAAQELGWSANALKWRLERGREMLRHRLTRRSLPLSAVLLGALLMEGGTALLPAALAQSTVQAATAGTVPVAILPLVPSAGICQVS